MNNHVFVVLPYYNREETLELAARSVLEQSHSDLTLCLVDDASTDDSRYVAHRIRDSRITHIYRSENGGASRARNAGIERASGHLLAFMDSDDVWLPGKLSSQVSQLERAQERDPNVVLIGCGWRPHGSLVARKEFTKGPYTRDDVLSGRVAGLGTPMLLVDRRLAGNERFDPNFPALEEKDYILSCLHSQRQAVVDENVLVEVRRGRLDHVATPERAARAYELLSSKYATDLRFRPTISSLYHFRAAKEHLRGGKRRAALVHLPEALHDDPVRRVAHLLLGAALGPRGLALAQKLVPLPHVLPRDSGAKAV